MRARATKRGKPARAPRASAAAKTKAARVWAILRETYPDAECALRHRDAYELLVATILSAQCTDARVNLVTPALFARWPDPKSLAEARIEDVEEAVRTTGFFRNKAKNLRGAAKRIVEAYGGDVPRSMEDLLTLPGVARKTANVVRGVAYGLSDGVVVDTHVARLATRLGWTKGENPRQIERDLMALFPRDAWIDLAHVLIHHGRRVCLARRPRCEECPVHRLCPASLV